LNDPDTLLSQLLISRISQIDEETRIEIDETRGLHKLSFWHFAPALHYDFINSNYYISLSTAALVNHFLGKRQEKKKLSAIDRRHRVRVANEEIRIKSKFASILKDVDNIALSRKILLNDEQIYRIKQQQYSNNEIDSETFLREKSAMLNKIKTHNSSVLSIEKEILELQSITGYELQADLTELYFDTGDY
jgi:hypothetical protein